MSKADDLGRRALQRLAEIWQIDSNRMGWTGADTMPGFDWWPGDFRVSAFIHTPKDAPPAADVKIIVSTAFLKELPIQSEFFVEMTALMSQTATSTYAWVYDPPEASEGFGGVTSQKMWFCSTAYVSEDTFGWMTNLLANMAIIQPINAQIQENMIPELLGVGAPDRSRPAKLADAGLDEILEVVNQIYAPHGQTPSRWSGTDEFEQFAQRWAKSDICFGTADRTMMTLETPFGEDSAIIRFLTAEKHLQLGHGLFVILQLPYADTSLDIARQVAQLNLLEAISWTGFPQFGCWHVSEVHLRGKVPGFTLFVPNALYQPGLATQIAFWFLARARWVRELQLPDVEDLPMMEIWMRRMEAMKKP